MGVVALIDVEDELCAAIEAAAPELRYLRWTSASLEGAWERQAEGVGRVVIGAHSSERMRLAEEVARRCPLATIVLLAPGADASEGVRALRAIGAPPAAASTLTDRERARLAEEALRTSEQRSRLLIEAVTDYAIFTLDPGGVVTSWNPGAQRLKGYRAADIIGQHFSRFYPEEEARSGKCERELEIAEQEGRFQEEGWRLRADGSRFFANVTITPIRDSGGKLLGFAKVSRDLTEPLEAEAQRSRLVAENAALTERARTQEFQERFLAILGHDLRNPLAAIDMGASLLRRTADARTTKILDRIGASAQRMSRMIEQILDLTRSRLGGGLEIVRAPTDLAGALREVVEELRAAHPSRRIELHSPATLPGELDRDRLLQVFSNIIGNAISYGSRTGAVVVRAWREGGHALVEVHNDGPSIPAELQLKLFDPFRRGNRDSRNAQTAGLGLGLFISHQIVTGHGGSIRVESSPEHGTSFRVALPLGADPEGTV